MKLKKILLLLGLLSIALVGHLQAQALNDLVAAQKTLIAKQDTELKIKNVMISNLESTQQTMAARYVAREQQLQTEVDGWKKRFELSEADRNRLQKERNQNRKFIAPGLGGAFVVGVVVGLLAR